MTPVGWVQAGDLKVGDKLFSQIHSETADCEITAVEVEKNQKYFGLNCANSEVKANGYWVSTFGDVHTLPAAWMKAMSAVVGVHKASAWGDCIANFLYGWGVLSA
jgi:hypothetical protein